LAALAALGTPEAQATDGIWLGTTSGEWTDGTNWSSNPTVPDFTVTFTNVAGTTAVTNTNLVNIGTVTFNANALAYTVSVQDSFLVNGNGIINNALAQTQTPSTTPAVWAPSSSRMAARRAPVPAR
jgi:hypothetical protein